MISHNTQPAFHNKKSSQLNKKNDLTIKSKSYVLSLTLGWLGVRCQLMKSKIKTQYIKNKYQTPTNNL